MYTIKQISAFLENKKGRLAEMTEVLAKESINIRALSLAENANFGVARMIVDNPDKCARVLKENNFIARETDVIAVEVSDKPGGLHKVVSVLDKAKINIEYMYATIERRKNNAVVIFRIDDNEKALKVLKSKHINVLKKDVF